MTMTLLTELQAVNIILQAIDEPPVSSLELSGLLPLDRAKAKLNECSLLVQSGGWSFNTEEDYPLTRQVDGTITLPENTLRVDVNDEFLPSVAPVLRGLRLYDKANRSYTFEKDLKGTVVFALSWDELPQPARHYIAHHAAVELQGLQSVSDTLIRGAERAKEAAWQALMQLEMDEGDHNVLRGSSSVLNILEGGLL